MDCSECPDNEGRPQKPYKPWCDHPCADWLAAEIDRVTDKDR